MIRIGLVADDLTGACDSALPFLPGGRVLVGLWPCVPSFGGLVCAAVSTESREAPEAAALERGAEAARRLLAGSALLFRKLDSMLRGHPAADLAGALEAAGGRCVVAPALPGEGRVTAGGVQRWPGGSADIRRLLTPLANRVEVRDAATDAELDMVAAEALARGDRVLAGTAGLAAALARALGAGPMPAAVRPGCVRPLAVVGSRAAARQADVARALGEDVQVVEPGALPVLDGHDGLVLTGGETAARVLRHVGASAVELLGQALPRAPLGRVRGGRLDGLPVVLKAGAFGGDDALHRALEALRAPR
ncbi:MAG TPA: four-carbon acid sugar kinase family protein [Candidatus Dormibacteraeota bacterium]|nr:four-carbon acid sugar kinase family protein [Candidatus Dormibacteraeota bacterium]